MGTKVTASCIERARRCPASFALPVVNLPPSEDAERGTAIHRFLEVALREGRDIALREISPEDQWFITCKNINIEEITNGADGIDCELALAYNPLSKTARIISGRAGCDYSKVTEDEIAGTADLVLTYGDGRVTIIDFKTGYHPVPVTTCAQLHLLGLAVARTRSLTEVKICIMRISESGEMKRDEVLLTTEDLDRIVERTASVFMRVREAREMVSAGRVPDVTVGEHCARCPAFSSCPVNVNLAKALISTEEVNACSINDLSAEEAGAAWEKLLRARRVLDELERALKAYIDHGPIPLPGGEREVARVEAARETINGRAALPILQQYLGPPATGELIEPVVTKKGIESFVLRLADSPAEGKAVFGALMSCLRTEGAILTTSSINYREHQIRRS